MQYTTPTTKNELIETLKSIFYYYRIRREGYEGPTLTALSLSNLNYVLSTDNQLETKAQCLLEGEQEREKQKYISDINEKIASLTVKLNNEDSNATTLSTEITALYSASENKIMQEATAKGYANSNAVLEKISILEGEKNTKLAQVVADKNARKTEIQAEITALNTKLSNVNTYFSTIFAKDVIAKKQELKLDEEKIQREVFKYNNTLSEKQQNSANSITQAEASLEIKYMQISAEQLSKDSLIEMGYYTDISECIRSYYNSMSYADAYSDLLNDDVIPIYLEDYYNSFLYLYKLRAGL